MESPPCRVRPSSKPTLPHCRSPPVAIVAVPGGGCRVAVGGEIAPGKGRSRATFSSRYTSSFCSIRAAARWSGTRRSWAVPWYLPGCRRERDFCRRRQAPQNLPKRDETYAQRRKSRPHDREKPAEEEEGDEEATIVVGWERPALFLRYPLSFSRSQHGRSVPAQIVAGVSSSSSVTLVRSEMLVNRRRSERRVC
jgi:hypothetical protein